MKSCPSCRQLPHHGVQGLLDGAEQSTVEENPSQVEMSGMLPSEPDAAMELNAVLHDRQRDRDRQCLGLQPIGKTRLSAPSCGGDRG
ncbi:hypothetical protein D3C80_1870800 [compost metagenome]